MSKEHHFSEIGDYLHLIRVEPEMTMQDFVIFNYEEVKQESWINLAAYRQHYFEISLEVTKGCSFKIDQFSYEPEGDRVSFISPQRLQSVEADINYQYTFRGYTIFFKPDFIDAAFNNSRFLKDYPFFSHFNSPFISLDPQQTELLNDLCHKIHYEYKHGGSFSREIIKSYLNILFMLGKRNYKATAVTPVAPGRDQEIFREFESLVQQNFLKYDTVKAYADKIHVSSKHLSETVKKVSGQNALHLIHTAQVNHAKSLLLQTDMTISEIAQELNFDNPDYFSSFFKRITGRRPSEFRIS